MIRSIIFFCCLIYNLHATAQQPRLMLPIGHSESIGLIDVSPSGNYIVTLDGDNLAIIWDKHTGRILKKFFNGKSKVLSVKFLSNTSLIWYYQNGDLIKTDIITDKRLLTKKVYNNNQIIVKGDKIIIYYKDAPGLFSFMSNNQERPNRIEIRNANNGELEKVLKGQYVVQFNEQGDKMATVNGDSILLYNSDYELTSSLKIVEDIQPKDSIRVYENDKLVMAYEDTLAINKKKVEISYIKYISDSVILVKTKFQVFKVNFLDFTQKLIAGRDKIGANSQIKADLENRKLFSIKEKQLWITDIDDTSKTQVKYFKHSLEDIYFSKLTPHTLYTVNDNGIISSFNYKTDETGSYKALAGWSNKFFSVNNNEFFVYGDDNRIVKGIVAPFTLTRYTGGHTNSIKYIGADRFSDNILIQKEGEKLLIKSKLKLQDVPSNLSQKSPKSISPIYDTSICLINYDDHKVVLYDTKNAVAFDSVQVNKDSLEKTMIYADYNENAVLIANSIILQAINNNSTVCFWDENNKLINKLMVHRLSKVVSSPNSKYFTMAGAFLNIFKVNYAANAASMDLHKSLEAETDLIAFSQDDTKLLFTTKQQQHQLFVYEIEKDSVLLKRTFASFITAISNTSNNNRIVVSTTDSIIVYNLNNVLEITSFPNLYGIVNVLHMVNDSLVLVGTNDGCVIYFDLALGKEKYRQILFDGSNDQIVLNSNKYYFGDKGKVKLLHYVTDSLDVITFEQLDVKYNRPDKVLETIGYSDKDLIESYRKAYYKRIKKLGIDTTAFRDDYSIPEADFANRDNIDYEQKNNQLQLHIKGNDPSYNLDRFNVWVNECPIYGVRGISLKSKNQKTLDTTLTITLSQSKNTIETSITDVNGIESYRKPLYVNYTPSNPVKEKIWFVGIGIDSFTDASHNLKWCTSDIQNLSREMKTKYGDVLQTKLLLNKDVTTQNITALKSYLQTNTAINDKVIIAYAGHGLFSKDFDYYLSTYDINFDKPEQQGCQYDIVEGLLDGIAARKKLLLLDACHSGEVDKEELKRMGEAKDALAKRGVEVVNYDTTSTTLGMKNSFELMQELFVNVGRNTGATVISAAGGTQFALEQNNLKGGVFTYSILEKMKENKPTTVSELQSHLNKRVSELTEGLQVPTTRSEVKNNDWRVW